MQNDNLSVAFKSSPCGTVFVLIAISLCRTNINICALLLIVSNVMQNDYVSVAYIICSE